MSLFNLSLQLRHYNEEDRGRSGTNPKTSPHRPNDADPAPFPVSTPLPRRGRVQRHCRTTAPSDKLKNTVTEFLCADS